MAGAAEFDSAVGAYACDRARRAIVRSGRRLSPRAVGDGLLRMGLGADAGHFVGWAASRSRPMPAVESEPDRRGFGNASPSGTSPWHRAVFRGACSSCPCDSFAAGLRAIGTRSPLVPTIPLKPSWEGSLRARSFLCKADIVLSLVSVTLERESEQKQQVNP